MLQPKLHAQSRQFFSLLALTLATVAIGLTMVASASAVDAFKETSNAAAIFLKQGGYALIGLTFMLIISNLSMDIMRGFAMLGLFVTMGAQAATVLIGQEINGNRNWLSFGAFGVQPSEFLKLGLIVALSLQLSQLTGYPEDDDPIWRRVWLFSAVSVGMVAVLSKDMGSGIIMVVLLLGLYLIAGIKTSHIMTIIIAGLAAAVFLVTSSASRRVRFDAWLNPEAADPMGVNWQFEKGTWALASGGIFGTGLGRSKLKWSWIPEVETDFIFAIIGEELGLIGALLVVALFLALGLVMFNIARLQTDPFNRNLVVGVMFWIVIQAFINMGVVVGLFPVLGVTLPLISAGGSSLIASLMAIGVVLAVERDRAANLGRRR
jgi:cell division protein FtsW (lipid II flippase)